MKKIEIIITPMNCGYNTGLNTLQTWDKTEFDTDTGERKVLFYDKDISKFSLKCGDGSVSRYGNTPYLEPVILGTTPTDIIDVEFDAKIDEEDASVVVSSALLAIHEDNTYDYITQKEESASVKARYETEVDTTYYKHYKMRIQLEGYKSTDKGIIYNFRYNDGITYDGNNIVTQAPTAKVTIKNLTLKIYTNNENLIADNKFVDFSTSNDMISNIKYMKNCSYSLGAEINKSYEKGYVTVSSNILSSNSSSTSYKGIAFDLGCKQVPTVCGVYFEYKNTTENTLAAHMGSDIYTIDDSKKVYLPIADDWAKKIIFLENLSSTTNSDMHRASLMLGTNVANANFSIRNIRLINIKNTTVDKAHLYNDTNDSGKVYTSLAELGLDTTATINDIIGAMANGSQITYKTDVFDYATEYNNIQYGTVTIHKQSDSRVQVFMTDKDTGNLYVGKMDNTNKFVGWRKDSFHRIVTQGTAGYFKFKPTSTGIDQPLRISVTDNYGGMINISGATPSSSQYKPFKCIRLSNGTYADYDAIKTTNNKMEKLYFYDGYFYLKVVSYTTCTFTGLIEAPTYVETFDNTDAEQIPIRSVFDTPYNNGYADPSIICIGDTASSDGVIKTLATLGFTSDIMTWDNGEYRVSHVSGLTNLPTEITEEKPGFRLEHYDVKKWGNNHNPHHSTYGCRQSILHYKGNVFVRYQESGATAGVITSDTGWQKLSKTVIIDKLADLGLTAPCTTAEVANALKRSKPQNNVAIAIIDCAPGQVSDVPSDYGLLHIETIGYDRISIRFESLGSSNYKGSWIGKIIGSGGTFSGVTWERTDNTYSTTETAIGTWIDGKTIYRKTFTKSPTSDQATGNQVTINVATISGLTNVIDIQATAKLYNYNNTSTPIYMKIPFTELWRSSSTSSASCAYSVYVEGTALKMRVNNCAPEDIYYVTVEYTK